MMRKTLPFVFVPSILALLAGCGSNSHHTVICSCPVTYAPVSITMTDDPPAGVSVLFFQVSLTNATLTPASSTGNPVSLLSNNTPIQVDVTQLQALSAFLGTMNAQPGTYSSLSLTFANPQLVIYNQSDTSLGSSCAVGSICQLTPSFDDNSATQTFTSSPFPLTLSNNSPISLLIDFHLNNVIQSDLSVNLGVSNGVTVSELPSSPAVPQFGFVTGTVLGSTPSLSQFTMQTQWGDTFTVGTTSSTTFNNFPSSVCAAAGFACLAQGQVVEAQISNFTGFSNVTASQVAYVQTANTQTVQGTIINVIPSATDIAGAPPMGFEMILHANPTNVTGFPLGGQALVCLPANTTYSIDAGGFTMPSGASFTSGNNLTVGQTVTVTAQPGSLNNPCLSGPPGSGVISFVASTIELEPSQMTGSITAIDSGTTSFTLGTGSLFFAPWPLPPGISSYNVLATSQTTFTGFDPDSFSGLATQDIVSVNGWVFQTDTSASPTIAAQSVVMRPSGTF